MSFLSENFLLHSDIARELFHEHAAKQPIFDYHCHLPPSQIAENHTFRNLTDAWLAGDHYKWRAMRSNGVAEKYCTGDATDREKFRAYAATVPYTLRNPLYHWSHLELQRYFGIDQLLNRDSADAIYEEASAQLAQKPVHKLLESQNVRVVCTTDDPIDSLEHHRAIAASGLRTRVYPAFRPDKALTVHAPEAFNAWTDALSAASNIDCGSLSKFLDALRSRHDFFHQMGGRLSDHGMEQAFAEECTEADARKIFDQVRAGTAADPDQTAQFGTFITLFCGRLDAARGWTQQFHLGAMRNNNTRMLRQLGPDTGFDSIGDFSQARSLSRLLDQLDQTNELPKTVLYNLNPADNYVFGTLIGNFQDGSVPGKIQFGSGWWFLDQKEGMEWQINALSNLGLLRRFVGMLTDSRSFLSFPRHEYFRRILCNLLGRDVENGELPRDMDLLSQMVREVSWENATDFFGLELP